MARGSLIKIAERDVRQGPMKRRILDHVTERLRIEDFCAISISDICRNLGISRTSFYENFQSKHDLYVQILYDFWRQNWLATEAQDLSYRESIAFTVRAIEANRAIFHNMMRKRMSAAEAIAISDVLMDMAYRELEYHRRHGRKIDFDVDLVCMHYSGSFWAIIAGWLQRGSDISAEQVIDNIVRIYEGKVALFVPEYERKRKNPRVYRGQVSTVSSGGNAGVPVQTVLDA